MSAIAWALVGWCGTKYPGWWRGPKPIPDPEPWWRSTFDGLVGAGAAIVVGNMLGGGLAEAGFAGMAVIAFATGAVAKDVLGGAMGAMGR